MPVLGCMIVIETTGLVPTDVPRVGPSVLREIMLATVVLLSRETAYNPARFTSSGVDQLVRTRLATTKVFFTILPTANGGIAVGRPGGDHHPASPIAVWTPPKCADSGNPLRMFFARFHHMTANQRICIWGNMIQTW